MLSPLPVLLIPHPKRAICVYAEIQPINQNSQNGNKPPTHPCNNLDISFRKNLYPIQVDGPWKLRAEPWIAIDGHRKGRLEAITLWASRNGLSPGLFLENDVQLPHLLTQLLSNPDVAHGIISTLAQNQEVDVPGDFTTSQLRSLGFEI